MRPAIVVAFLVVGMPLSVLAPVASAVAYCTIVGPTYTCSDHIVCVGWSRDPWTGAERCQYGLRDPCDYWNSLCRLDAALP